MAVKPLFQGSATALATPFANGKVDAPALRRLVNFQLENGTAALLACGTTGEPSSMTADEKLLVIRETVKAAGGRAPVIAGTGSNCTRDVIETANRYRDEGCAAQLVVTPYYNKTTQEGMYRHFMEIADHTALPVIIYNVPARTTLDISPGTLARIAGDERFAGIKESSYDIPYVMEKIRAVGDSFPFFCGNDDTALPMMALGACGVISVVANILPREVAQMADSYLNGRHADALKTQLRLMPLIRALFAEVSPIPCKAAMEMMGLCAGEVRLPLVPIGENAGKNLREALLDLGVKL